MSIDLNNIINAILVEEGVRPACLIQPADYFEATGKDENMMAIKAKIKSFFPDLILSEKYTTYQGTIVSKKSYDGEEISLTRMGEILGYPCYRDFNQFNRNDEYTYFIEIMIVFKNNSSEQLLVNICKNREEESAFQEIADKAKAALTKEKYKTILEDNEVEQIHVVIQSDIPSKVLVDKLMLHKVLTREEKQALQNILYNFGFTMKLQYYNFQYDNPLQIGIIVGILLLSRNYPLSPFFPLQKYPKQDKQIATLLLDWEQEILDALEKTKDKTRRVTKSRRLTKLRRFKSI